MIGTWKGKHELKVNKGRYLLAFILRLETTVTAEELSIYVKSVHNLDAKCIKRKTKHESYASFKIKVICNNASRFF